MRIIDSKYDYYDYLQNYTDPIVFDRRGSRVLTKEDVCHALSLYNDRTDKYLLLLHCGATYWLILVTITEKEKRYWGTREIPINYDLKVLSKWADYSKKRELISLDVITVPIWKIYKDTYSFETLEEAVIKYIDEIKETIRVDDYTHERICSTYCKKWDYDLRDYVEQYQPPLLKACGISNVIDPMEIFLAIEEHFSLLKTEAERTEPLGTTNDDKIIMHGFDTKTSFRG